MPRLLQRLAALALLVAVLVVITIALGPVWAVLAAVDVVFSALFGRLPVRDRVLGGVALAALLVAAAAITGQWAVLVLPVAVGGAVAAVGYTGAEPVRPYPVPIDARRHWGGA